jgi:hypothetical protein
MTTHEFAFDVTLSAVVRVTADTEEAARRSLVRTLDATALNVDLYDEYVRIRITEASVWFDGSNYPVLFEADGVILDSA